MAEIGSIIFEKYEILKLIGRGGMSRVYLAMDTHLNKQWVIKEVDRMGRGRKARASIDAILAEANLMKKLDHPALPRIVDILETEKVFYIVMDYIEGETLEKILNRKGPIPPDQVILWSVQLAQVLDYLHSLDPPVIYRDMKPSNVIVSPESQIRLIDFGIAREYKPGKKQDTRILGTPGYAAPEQSGFFQTDARTDIYSLGMTMYTMLTGRKPPGFKEQAAVDEKIPEELAEIIRRCTMIDPDRRYRTCRELLYDLKNSAKLTAAYRKKRARKITIFLVLFFISAACFPAGIGCRLYAENLKKSHYENLISLISTIDTEKRRKNFLEAAELCPDRTEACSRLLDAYQEDGSFTPDESRELISVISRNKDNLQTDGDTADLFCRIGILYLGFYRESDGTYSFADRVRRAAPFFEEAETVRAAAASEKNQKSAEKEKTNGKVLPEEEIFSRICRFYEDYVLESSLKEGSREDYAGFIESLAEGLEQSRAYDTYTRLSLDNTAFLLLYDQRANLKKAGIEPQEVLNLLDRAEEDAKTVPTGKKASLKLREEILNNYTDFREAIQRTFHADSTEYRQED
ncbi:MAG: serine/threonine-protein kinase [Eubacterium sp.]|nr:serine/threonine-protein kinase [Eubacterium sp.]